jgi:hypothetical protein
VAIPVELELHTPPPVALLKEEDIPGHTTPFPVIAAGAGLIVIVMMLDDAVGLEIQVAVEIITHDTVLPEESELFT